MNLAEELKPNSIIVDLGMGQSQFLLDLAVLLKKKCTLIGVSASPSEIQTKKCDLANNSIVRGKAQYDESILLLLRDDQCQVDRVFDAFGPATDAQNPLHALLYAALLLKTHGKYSAVSPVDEENNTMFGNEKTRQTIRAFFKEQLGTSVSLNQPQLNLESIRDKLKQVY